MTKVRRKREHEDGRGPGVTSGLGGRGDLLLWMVCVAHVAAQIQYQKAVKRVQGFRY